jgi:AraC-like DNA-binding protein
LPRNTAATVTLKKTPWQPIVQLRYLDAVMVDVTAEDFGDIMLVMTGTSGTGEVTQAGLSTGWRPNRTIPVSYGCDTRFRFDDRFEQTSLRIAVAQVEQMCERWLGRPMSRPLRFAPQPFSQDLEASWQGAMNMLSMMDPLQPMLPQSVARSIDEFMLSMLLWCHPHNFSDELRQPAIPASLRIVLEAEGLFEEGMHAGITISDVAAQLSVSVRALQAGFKKWRQSSPHTALRRARLMGARKEFENPDFSTSVTDIAMKFGFAHVGRFGMAYKEEFGESPGCTLRRGRVSRR